VRDISVSVMN